MTGTYIAVIFAGGSGGRMEDSSRPKQFFELYGKPVLVYTMEPFQAHAQIQGIVLAAPKDWLDFCREMASRWHLDKLAAVVPGGSTGQASIRAGLEKARELYGEETAVLIHDGVRPLIDGETITRCIHSLEQYGSAVTVSPQTETVMLAETEKGPFQIPDRDKCLAARAPQCFYLKDILAAHRRAENDGGLRFVDSASLMTHYGYRLHPVLGPGENIKITTALDFRIFQAIMEERSGRENLPGLMKESAGGEDSAGLMKKSRKGGEGEGDFE